MIRAASKCGVVLFVFLWGRADCFFHRKKAHREYTHLVYFFSNSESGRDLSMERVISDVEKELNVRVERLNISKNPAAAISLSLVSEGRNAAPCLYNRESCCVFPSDDKKEVPTKTDVKTWAKGRFITTSDTYAAPHKSKRRPEFAGKENSFLEQDELADSIKEQSLTPEELEGKRLVDKRV